MIFFLGLNLVFVFVFRYYLSIKSVEDNHKYVLFGCLRYTEAAINSGGDKTRKVSCRQLATPAFIKLHVSKMDRRFSAPRPAALDHSRTVWSYPRNPDMTHLLPTHSS